MESRQKFLPYAGRSALAMSALISGLVWSGLLIGQTFADHIITVAAVLLVMLQPTETWQYNMMRQDRTEKQEEQEKEINL